LYNHDRIKKKGIKMASVKVTINDTTYTMVLDGAGYIHTRCDMEYLFSDTEPTGIGMARLTGDEVSSIAGQVMWARSTDFKVGVVISNEEA
jgi:hypothetical protein